MIFEKSTVKYNSPYQLSKVDRKGWLVVISGKDIGSLYPLEKLLTVVGRSRKADILIDETDVSREHAVIYNNDFQYNILDQHSKNGVFVNHDKVKSKNLENNDIIMIGKTVFKFIQYNPEELEYHKNLFSMIRYDFLTSTYNRRFFHYLLKREYLEFLRYNNVFSVAIMDLDNMKQIFLLLLLVLLLIQKFL